MIVLGHEHLLEGLLVEAGLCFGHGVHWKVIAATKVSDVNLGVARKQGFDNQSLGPFSIDGGCREDRQAKSPINLCQVTCSPATIQPGSGSHRVVPRSAG